MASTPGFPADGIKCPKCGEVIRITDTLRSQLREQTRAELDAEFQQQEKRASNRQIELDAKEKQLREMEQGLERLVQARVTAEQERITADALTKARAEVSITLQDLKAAEQEKASQLEEARKRELELRKKNRQLESSKQELELEVARRLDAERQQIRNATLKEADEAHRLKDAEKDSKLAEALRMNEELRRKLEQGSQQMQGEVLEIEIEQMLRDSCPNDDICEVPKGMRGADVFQRVKNRAGIDCGSIIWEAKNAKHWNDQWVAKLKNDQKTCKADLAVVVSETLPKDVDMFGTKDGVWVTNRRFVPALVAALRQSIIEITQAKRAAAGKNEIVQALFEYATGPQFRQHVESIARNFAEMKDDLESEKRSTTKRWAKRSKQLDLIIVDTSEMYGELQAFVGKGMKPIQLLEESEAGENGSNDRFEIAAATDHE